MKELEEMQAFLREHPHSKAGNLYTNELKRLIEAGEGDLIKLCATCFSVGFVRGMHANAYYQKKARRKAAEAAEAARAMH